MSAVAVLALQGAFAEHGAMLTRLGVEWFEVRQRQDLERPFGGLVLPGGESTVMGQLLRTLELFVPLRERIAGGLPVLGTCAGLILLSRRVEGGVPCFGTLDATARRNAYGRQLDSFHTMGEVEGVGEVPMTFIRAPVLAELGPEAHPLATVGGRVVAARQGNQIAVAFHPELTENTAIHRLFLELME